MTRISTLAQNTLLTSYALQTQSRVGDLQVQVASGFKSQSYSGIASDTSRLLNLESQRSSAKSYITSITTVQTRIKLMSKGIDSLEDVGTQIKNLVTNTNNTQAAFDTNVWQTADDLMKHIQEVLNTQDDSGYLFAGARRDNPPVDTSYATINAAPPFPAAPAGGPPPLTPAAPLSQAQIDQIAQAYYSGANTGANLSVKISDNAPPVSYGVKGDDDAFKNLIAGLHMIRQANSKFPAPASSAADIDQSYLQNGLELITKAITGQPSANYPTATSSLRQIAGTLSGVNTTLGRQLDIHNNFIAYSESAIGDIEQVDTAEAVAKLNSDKIALEASFSTLARMQDTTLLNYLK